VAGGHPRERAALIVTVLNEARTLDALLHSVNAQTRAPDEIVIVDGGSTDGTLAILERWSTELPIHVIRAPGANISRGRNLAIEATSAEVIAVTDAGVRLEPDWLAQLEAKLTPLVDVVSGFFGPDPRGVFERALAATTLPHRRDVRPRTFLPSSRSVLFRRSAWQRVGGYPEWLDYCEDLVFDLALKRAGCRFAFAPAAMVWFRPRSSVAAFFRQYYLYARGDGKAGLWPRRHAIRYATYVLAALVLTRRSRLAWLIPVGVLAYTRRPFARLDLAGLSLQQTALALACVPMLRAVGDLAKMLGYPVGVWWKVRQGHRWTSRSSS
jgi:glycosyltransferase involved in cell wall biosynthesis